MGVDAHNSIKAWYTRVLMYAIKSKPGTHECRCTQFNQSLIHMGVDAQFSQSLVHMGVDAQFSQSLVHVGVDVHTSVKAWYTRVLMYTIQPKPDTHGC